MHGKNLSTRLSMKIFGYYLFQVYHGLRKFLTHVEVGFGSRANLRSLDSLNLV